MKNILLILMVFGIVGCSKVSNFKDAVIESWENAKKRVEIMEESRANPDNRYKTIEECLSDNTEMIEYTSRDEWCDSEYVRIINLDPLVGLEDM